MIKMNKSRFLIYLQKENLSFYNVLETLKEYDMILSIIDQHDYDFLSDAQLYDMIMYNIKSITNMKIKLSNGHVIYCYEPLVKTIPYFKLLLEDAQDNQWDHYKELYVDFDPESMKVIIDSLYSNIRLNLSNIFPVMTLMDQLLYDQPIDDIMTFLTVNLKTIIQILLKNENIEKLVILQTFIYNIGYHHSNYDTNGLLKEFSICDQWLFSFPHWKVIFSSDQQYNAIVQNKQYELFDQSTIEPKQILTFLIQTFPEKNGYDHVMHQYEECDPHAVYYGKINNITYSHIVIIKSYYPNFQYDLYANIVDLTSYEDTIKITLQYSTNKITVGSTLIIQSTFGENNIEYTVQEIYKCVNGQKFKTTKLVHSDIISIYYELTLDKCVPHSNEILNIWVKRQFSEI